ncbi:MAG: hypothetical protein WCJ56_12445 [bacterium]
MKQHPGKCLLAMLLLLLLTVGVAQAVNYDTASITKNDVLTAENDNEQLKNLAGASNTANILIFTEGENAVYIWDRQAKKVSKVDVKIPANIAGMENMFGGLLGAMAGMLNQRWSVSVTDDEKTVCFPSDVRVLTSDAAGVVTALVEASKNTKDENNLVLSANMTADGTKCVYVVGPEMNMGAFGALMGGPGMASPEMRVYLTKTKKSVPISKVKGIGTMWTADGKCIVYEAQNDVTRAGELWILDEKLNSKRLPVGASGVSGGKDVPENGAPPAAGNPPAAIPAIPGIPGFPGGIPGMPPGMVMPGGNPAAGAGDVTGGSPESRTPAELPTRYTGKFTTSGVSAHISGDYLLVKRNFTDQDAKKMLYKSYAFAVDTTTLATVKLDFLPEKVYAILALDTLAKDQIVAFVAGEEKTGGIYLLDIAKKQARMLVATEQNKLGTSSSLLVRNGKIIATYNGEIHEISLGEVALKQITFTAKGAAAGTTYHVYAAEMNPLTGEVTGVDKNADKGTVKVDKVNGATSTATQLTVTAKVIEANDLLVDGAGAVVGTVN